MNRSVAYQETSNNFTSTNQKINGAQITTVKQFGGQPPLTPGDFVGQFGLTVNSAGHALLYVYGLTDWALVGTSDDTSLPDTVVREDIDNNFTNLNQRIGDCPITYLDSGPTPADRVTIKGIGHIYVQEGVKPILSMSFDGNNWTRLITSDEDFDFLQADKPNDFTDKNQTIQSSPIMSLKKGSQDPNGLIIPSREGEFYIQLAEGTTDKRARMWAANNAGGWKWEPLSHVFDLPDTVAQTSKGNNFQTTNQQIAGKQIMSFVDGGDLTPEQSKLVADYDGQFYIAVKTLAGGAKDVAVWVAKGNQWLPVAGVSDIDDSNYAKLDTSNIFTNPIQLLGDPADTRMISGTRIKRDRSPIADSAWKARVEGEQTIYINDNVTPTEISIWTAVKVNTGPTNVGEWMMTWTSKQNVAQNVALTDKENTFVPLQRMGVDSNLVFLTGARADGLRPSGRTVPLAFGETYIHRLAGTNEFDIYMAAEEGDTDSWVRIYEHGWKHSIEQRIIAVENEDTAFDVQLKSLGDDLDDLAKTIGSLDSELTVFQQDIEIVKNNVANLSGRVTTLESILVGINARLEALESKP